MSRYQPPGELPPPPSSQADSYSQVPKTHRVMTLADHISVRNTVLHFYSRRSNAASVRIIRCSGLSLTFVGAFVFHLNAAYNNPGLCPKSGPPSLLLSTFLVPEHPATSVFVGSSQSTQPLQSWEPGPEPAPSETLQQGVSRKCPRQAQSPVNKQRILTGSSF